VRIRVVDTVPGLSVEFRDWEPGASRLTLGDLLWERVRQEVEEFNRDGTGIYTGLIAPEESQPVLNGYRLIQRHRLDPEHEYQRAVRAFEADGFMVLAGGRQIESLGEEIDLESANEVEFVRLG
jgi:hypothetical protein